MHTKHHRLLVKRHRIRQQRKHRQRKHRKLFAMSIGILSLASIALIFTGFRYLQSIDHSLPEAKIAFEKQNYTSRILDRSGKELYKLVGEEARDPVALKQVPEKAIWAFLAAEDIDFYNHEGVDPNAILRCSLNYLADPDKPVCGGSTITQQLVKITTKDNTVNIDRKLRELLISLKIEQQYSKDEILQQYLTVIPMGSNLYGLTTGSSYYFGKSPKDLTLAEAALLAAIIQNPVALSPTLGLPDPKIAREKAIARQNYILDRLEANLTKINDQSRKNHDDPEQDDIITKEDIAAARAQKLKFKKPVYTEKKAGHFVDYSILLLTTRNYNKGRPFTLAELQTGGYKIYTTLDYDLQTQAEAAVTVAAKRFQTSYGANNAAMMTMQPSTGEILTMVGSKDYNAKSSGCDKKGNRCSFDPQVNVLLTRQSPGSSTKPFAIYEAYREGKLFTGSLLPDVPITIGTYKPKNYNGSFFGVSSYTTAASMLCASRNLPAIVTVELIGVDRFLSVMKEFGYTTYNNRKIYGESVVLGGADIKGVEHAQGYAVFANGGKFVQEEAIRKIVDSQGNVVYEHKPKAKQVADARAAYMLNYSLNGCNGGSWDGRNVATKTGTSEDNADVWTASWSPDFVTVAWAGNNNNNPMTTWAYGESMTVPLIKNYMRQVADAKYFVRARSFGMPPGLKFGGGVSENGYQRGMVRGIMMVDKLPPVDILNRRNECGGYSQYYKMPVPGWQHFLDAYLNHEGRPNGQSGCDSG